MDGVAAVDHGVLAVDADLRVARLELTDVQRFGELAAEPVVGLELVRLRVREVDDELLLQVRMRRDVIRHIVAVHADLDAQGLPPVDLGLIRLEVIELCTASRFAASLLCGRMAERHASSMKHSAAARHILLNKKGSSFSSPSCMS